jgi:hypothetical protein
MVTSASTAVSQLAERARAAIGPPVSGDTAMYALIAIGLAVGAMAILNLIEFKRLD